jgi:hypothetical protein
VGQERGGRGVTGTEYWRAYEVEKIVADLIPLHHDHLSRTDVTIRCVFRSPTGKRRGHIVLGRARRISGLNAHLVGLDKRDDLNDDPVDFFCIEVASEPWHELTMPQREALVDHELCHFWVSLPDDPEDHRKLVMLGHDLEEFNAVVRRHGLWRPDLKAMAKAIKQGPQLALEDEEESAVADAMADALRTGSGGDQS